MKMKKNWTGFLLLAFLLWSNAPDLNAQPSPDVLAKGFHWRNIGPANQGGRIVDIEAVENDFAHVFIASASGGVWKSQNAGTTWQPIFDHYPVASIGDIALFQPKPDIIWVGTGEANNRNSVSWGNGIYKSSDGGKTFQHLGLENTFQIARVVTHPKDSNTVYVGAIGNLWGYTGDRGLFKTTNGGKTWEKLTAGLPNDGKTGVTDLVMDPSNPNILYAAFYQRLRQPWTFYSGGPNGGIFKSTNGGRTWKKLAKGLPEGESGRIGLAISRKNPNVLMTLFEAKRSVSLDTLGSGVYRSEDGGDTWKYVNTYNNRPFYYSQIRIHPHDDQKVYLLTTRFMVSSDAGKTFFNGSEDEEVHGDFHAMWLDPTNPNRYYLGADKGASLTHDHGAHFQLMDNFAIGQFYRIGLDMRDPYYIYGGFQDNGSFATASFTRDARGILNDSNWKMHWGDGQYAISDPTNWRNMYSSAENGGYVRYDPLTHRIESIGPSPSNITNYDAVIPKALQKGGQEFRYNWSGPLVMSPHDPKIIYAGANYLFRSNDQGTTWTIVSPDLTTNAPEKTQIGQSGGVTPDNTGAETHCTIFSIAVSPVQSEVIWIGTDDGNVQVTQNGGTTWQNVRATIPEVPQHTWVSRVEASHFDAGVAYVSFDGHRSDNFQPWIFKTSDYGKTWIKVVHGLPADLVVRVIIEDLKNPNLLFIGAETGIYYSLDGGANWSEFMPDFPTVSVYDLKIHPRDHDLVAGTHGRSIWIADDITPLQQFTDEVQQSDSWLFEQRVATLWENVSRGGQRGHFWFAGENPPSIENTTSKPRAGFANRAMISYYIGEKASSPTQLVISEIYGKNKRVVDLDTQPGIHRYFWNLEFDALPYSTDEKQGVEAAFQSILAAHPTNFVRLIYNQYKIAKTPIEQKKAVDSMRRFDDHHLLEHNWGVPKAGPGSYLLELNVGGKIQRRTLVIREDPIRTLDAGR